MKTRDHHKLTASKARGSLIKVSGVSNFRDIGGYTTCSGHHIRRGLIFRSADLSGLTTEGKAKLEALGLCSIFDLRREEEIKSHIVNDFVYEQWLSSPKGPQRLITPIFRDDDFTPEALAQRLRGYSDDSTKVRSRETRELKLKPEYHREL